MYETADVVRGAPIIDLVNARKDEIRSAVNASEQFKLGQNIAAEFKLEIDNETLYTGTLERIQNRRQGKQYGTSYPLFNDDELVLTRSLETNPKRESRISRNKLIPIKDINMETFNIVPWDEVNKKISAMEGKHYAEDKHAEFDEGFKSLKIEVRDTNPGDIPVPIEFQHKSVAVVVPVFKEVLPSTLISNMEEQKATPIFDEQKDTLNKLMSANKPLLEGSKKILGSIEKVLQKDTQSELKARYDALKESIKAPVEQLNKTLKSNLEKIARAHNSGIQIQLQKTTAATNETRRKYKLEIQKTRKQVADRLAGKTKSRLGLLKSSKLQGLEKSLSQEEAEIKSVIAIAKRYIGVKETLLNWVRNSNDKTKLTEEQIETLVEGFDTAGYENACFNFINKMNGNTMEIIALVLRELREQLSVFKTSSPHNYPAFKNIVIRFMDSLIIMSQSTQTSRLVEEENVEDALSQSIDLYEKNDGSYFTPMILFDIKQKLVDILDDATPVISEGSVSERTDSTSKTASTSSTTTSKSVYDNKREEQRLRALEKKRQLDTLTPAIEEVKMFLSEYIPNIQPGEVLLTTAKQIKSFIGKETGKTKEKHYYLAVDGKVKKIGSNMTYKLSINADGSIPPQLAHLGTVKQARADSLSGVNTADIYGSDKSLSSFMESPQASNYLGRSDSTKSSSSSSPSLNLVKLSSKSNVSDSGKSGEVYYGPEPPPQRSLKNRAFGFVKGVGKFLKMRNSLKNTQGGRRRTRKFRKNKTHKKR